MNNRIRDIRKTLNLTMEVFGQRIGVSKSTISNIENGNRDATEHMIKSICREYGVDYTWLTSGNGSMFIENDDDFYERIDHIMTNETDIRKNLFKSLLYASDEEIKSLEKWINFCSNIKKGED